MTHITEEEHQIAFLEEEDNLTLLEHIREVSDNFENKLAQLSILRELGKTLHHLNDFRKICEIILDVTISNTIARNCSIMLMDFDENKLFLVAATNPEGTSYIIDPNNLFSKEDLTYTFSPGDGVAGIAIQKRQPILINDVYKSPIFFSDRMTRVSIGTLLSVPLIIEGTAWGVLTLSHPGIKNFTTDDIYLFTIVADFVALAINSALSYITLKHSEERYRALSEYSNDGICIIQNNAHHYANPYYKSLCGYSFKELRDIPFNDLMVSRHEGSEGHLGPNIFKSNLPGTIEAVMKTKGDRKINVEINYAPLLFRGRPAKVLSVRDLSERNELEKRLKQAQKMEALGMIAGGVAHDLNNILSGITSYPELILLELPKDSPLIKPVQTIKKSGEKAIATVQDLLTLTRRGTATKESINLGNIVYDYIESPEHEKLKTYHPGVQVITDLDSNLLNIIGSPFHLSKTVLNLVLNAAEAMPDGGKILISTQNRYIDTPVQGYELINEGNYVVLTITDTGGGISPEDAEKLFEPFYTKKKLGRSGTGLGLPVVWGTVKDHDGYIDIRSAEGKGTSFSLYFPATMEPACKNMNHHGLAEYLGNGETILVVDDIAEQREITSHILLKLGYRVKAVESGEAAVEYLNNNRTDLIVLDMIMEPGMDGLDTYRKILDIYPGQKAIITSGFIETDRVKEAQRLGANTYIKKPYLLEEIGIAIKNEFTSG